MTNRSKNIGTWTETRVALYLRKEIFANCDRRALAGRFDKGDIINTPGVCFEVKGGLAAKTASDNQVLAWLAEVDAEVANSGASLGVLVLHRAGFGATRVGSWWAIVRVGDLLRLAHATSRLSDSLPPVRMRLEDLVALLARVGYGESEAA